MMEESLHKVLVVCRAPEKNTGGYWVVNRNIEMLKSTYGKERIKIFYIPMPSICSRIENLLLNESYGLTFLLRIKLEKILKKEKFALAFIDSSLYGQTVKRLHTLGIPTIVFYHNVESDYYKSKYRISHNPLDFLMSKYIRNNESKSTKYGTKLITLNERDSQGLARKYNRRSDLILPTSFPRRVMSGKSFSRYEEYCLFVGSDFFANQEGISWFIQEVAPHINIQVWIAGNICKFIHTKFNRALPSNIKLLGVVDNLDEIYLNASCVISPIFSGSGLKTKSIEALSFGKTLLGTTEAFQGVEGEISQIGSLCNTAEEFIKELNAVDGTKKMNEEALRFFINNFSHEIIFCKFDTFVKRNGLDL